MYNQKNRDGLYMQIYLWILIISFICILFALISFAFFNSNIPYTGI